MFGDFLLVVSANFIKTGDYYLINGIWVFVAPLGIYQTIWILRFLEMALLHTDPVSRQRAAADVIDHVQAACFYIAAGILLNNPNSNAFAFSDVNITALVDTFYTYLTEDIRDKAGGKSKKWIYNEFLEIMKEFKAQR